jgi:hypothetical protein
MIDPQKGIDTVLLAPLAAAAATAERTASWDTVQVDGTAKYAEIRMVFSAEATTDNVGPTISLLESDDTVVTNHATFDSNFERSAETLTAAKEVRYLVNLLGRKRYLRLVVTPGTVATNDQIQFCAIGTLSRTGVVPGSTTDMGDDTVVIG